MNKKHLILVLLFLTFTSICYTDTAIPSINTLMSIDDQQRTGVIKLTQTQKMELAKWLIQHGCYQRPPQPKAVSHTPFSIYYRPPETTKHVQVIKIEKIKQVF